MFENAPIGIAAWPFNLRGNTKMQWKGVERFHTGLPLAHFLN